MKKINKLYKIIIYIYIIIGTLEGFVSVFQFIRSRIQVKPLNEVTGTFDNSGILGGFLALTCILVYFEYKKKEALMKNTYLFLLILMLFPLIITFSRAAWLAFIIPIATSYICKHKNLIIVRSSGYKSVFSIIFILLFCAIAFKLKENSALSRIFIWKISLLTITKNIWGYGLDNVMGQYGLEQELYFQEGHSSSIEQKIADVPEHIFNEYLHYALAWGIVFAFISIFLIIFTIYHNIKIRQKSAAASVLSIAIFSMFSYPFSYSLFVSYLIINIIVALLDYTINNKTNNRLLSSATIIFLFSVLILYNVNHIKEHIDRQNMADKESFYTNTDPNLILNYAKILIYQGQYKKADKVLSKGLHSSADPIFLIFKGKIAQKYHYFKKAEYYYTRARYRVPNRIYPNYLLAELYYQTKEKYKFEKTADKVLKMSPKINSSAIIEMKHRIIALKKNINIQ